MDLYSVKSDGTLLMLAPLSTIKTVFQLANEAVERIQNENPCTLHLNGRACVFNVKSIVVVYNSEAWQALPTDENEAA